MGICQCSIDIDHDSGPEFFKTERRKARTSHKCFECSKVIQPGEAYCCESGKWDGDFRTYKTCLDCLSVRQTFFCGWMYGNVWEDFHEEALQNDGRFSQDCIDLLTPVAKRRVLDIIKEIRREFHEAMDDQ